MMCCILLPYRRIFLAICRHTCIFNMRFAQNKVMAVSDDSHDAFVPVAQTKMTEHPIGKNA